MNVLSIQCVLPSKDLNLIQSRLPPTYILTIDMKIDNLDRISIPTKIVATFEVEHPIHGTTYGPK